VIAYLLAAGYATRLHPLTLDRPKPLLEVGGRPLLTHLVRRVEEVDALESLVVIGNHRFQEQLEEWRRATPCRVPLTLLDDGSTSDDDKLGAIGDLAFATAAVPPGDSPWLVAAGDNLLDFDLRPLWRRFREEPTPLLTLRSVERGAGPSRYNEVALAADGSVAWFREKPADPKTGLAALALYFFPPETAADLRAYLEGGGERDAPGHFIAWLVGRRRVRAARFAGSWHDIGNLETLAAARRAFGDPGEG